MSSNHKISNFLRSGKITRVLSLLDQVLFSAANFFMTVTIAKFFSTEQLAIYGVTLSIALVLQGIQRNVYVIQLSLLTRRNFEALRKFVTSQHTVLMVVWLVLFAILNSVTVLFFKQHADFVAAATMCCLIYFQSEFDRSVFFKVGSHIYSAVWSFMFFLLVCAIPVIHLFTVVDVSFAEYCYAVSVLFLLKSIFVARLGGGFHFRKGAHYLAQSIRRNLRWSALGMIGFAGINHAPVFALSILSTPAAVAAFTVYRSFTQPLQVILRSLDVVDKNSYATKLKKEGFSIASLFWRTFFRYLSLGIVLGSLLAVVGYFLVPVLYGPDVTGHRVTGILFIIIAILITLSGPIESVVYSRGKQKQYAFSRLIAGVGATALSFALAPSGADLGGALAALLGWVLSTAGGIFIIRRYVSS